MAKSGEVSRSSSTKTKASSQGEVEPQSLPLGRTSTAENDRSPLGPIETVKHFISQRSARSAPPLTHNELLQVLQYYSEDKPRADGRKVLTDEAAYEQLGFSFRARKKWGILAVIFFVQISMNWNASIYANAIFGMAKQFGFDVSSVILRLGQLIFLVAYAVGCELWAPWSEELGRKWVLQGSLLLVNLWQIPCALAPNFWVMFAFRFLGGLSSAGGSVTLGMVADMFEPADQQYAVAFVVLASVAGSVVAPICGGAITQYLSWHWVFWISLIFGVVVQLLHIVFVPETRSSILLTQYAERLRKQFPACGIYSPDEMKGATLKDRLNWKECCTLMWRPYMFLLKEPIVGFLSLLSGFSDALIFLGLDSFGMVNDLWGFNFISKGLAFFALLIGYIIAYAAFMWVYRCDRKFMAAYKEQQATVPKAEKNDLHALLAEATEKLPATQDQEKTLAFDPETTTVRPSKRTTPERRLWLLLWLVPLEPIGLFLYAWCSWGSEVPWITAQICAALIGIANFAIYMATIDYMVAAYGPYAASATGGNGFCRDILAGIAALVAHPMYTGIKNGTRWQLVVPNLILAAVSVIIVIPVYIFYFYGEWCRNHSKWAIDVDGERKQAEGERTEAISRQSTPGGSPHASRAASLAPSL